MKISTPSRIPGTPKPGSAKGRSERWSQFRSNGTGERGKSHVTLGTTMALIPKVFSDDLVGEIWKLATD